MITHRTPFFLLSAVLTLCIVYPLSAIEPAKSFPVVKSGCTNYPPFCTIDKNGNAGGFSAELLRAALQKMHRNIEFRTGPWNEIQNALEKSEIRVLPMVGRTPEREKKFDFTFPYLSFHGALVVRDSTKDINGTDDLKDKDVAVAKDGSIEEFLRRKNIGCKIHTTSTYTDALTALSGGKCDAVVIQRLLAVKLIQEAGLSNLRIVDNPVEELHQDFCFAVKCGDKEMLSILNEGLALVMADGAFGRLQAKWFSGLQRISGRKTIIAVEEGLPPYSYIDKGKVAGFNVDLTRAIAEASGLDIEIVYKPWDIICKGLQSGAIDAVCGISYSEERDSVLDFSPPFAALNLSAFGRAGKPDIRTLDDLRGKKLIGIDGSFMSEYIIRHHLTDSFTTAVNEGTVIRMFDSGNYDYALTSKLSGLYWIKQLNLKNIKLTSPVLLSSNYCYAVNEGNSDLLLKLNEGLAIVKQNGQYKKIYDRWLGILESNRNITTILKDAAMVLLPLLFILVCAIIWSWMLKRQVGRRTAQLNKEILQHKKTEEELVQSELKWKTLYNTLPVGVTLIDKQGRAVEANPAFYAIHNFDENGLRNRCYTKWKFYRSDGLEMSLSDFPSYQAMRDQRIIKDEEIGVKFENGEMIWIKISAAPIDLSEIGCVVSCIDITNRKKAEEQLAKISERLSLAASSAQLGIWDWDLNDNSMTWDNRMFELYGCTNNTFCGTVYAWLNNLHPEDKQRIIDEINQAISGEKEFHTSYRIVHTNGTTLFIRADAIVIRDHNGKAVRMTGINRDVTENNKIQEALQKTQKLESLGVLAGGIAHDFNNLLGGIYGCFEVVSECEDQKKVSLFLKRALGSIDRARSLTSQLLTFAKGGAPVKKIEKLTPFIQESVSFALSGSNVSCEFKIAKDLWRCEFDKNQVGQVIDNLVINAKQAMIDGGKIKISAENITIKKGHEVLKEGSYVKISVKDNGSGIPEEIQPQIFDPFFTTKSSGHGLGLSTCFSIISRHGGYIDFDSQKGKGTTFHFYLPALPGYDNVEIKSLQPTHKGSGIFILMDDEEVVLEVMSEMLESLGYSIVCMHDGKEVIEYLKSINDEEIKKIAGIICDITIPGGMGGKEVVEEILKITSRIPVFATSGYADDPVMADPASYGFRASICKPFRKSELGEMLNRT
jgi:PAS domain S-box-containing protein